MIVKLTSKDIYYISIKVAKAYTDRIAIFGSGGYSYTEPLTILVTIATDPVH